MAPTTTFAQTADVTERFTFKPAPQMFTVPDRVTLVTFVLRGGDGAGGLGSAAPSRGSTVTATLRVSPGQVFELRTGGRGDNSDSGGLGGYNGGGAAGASDDPRALSGGGGGATELRLKGGPVLLLAAGGGGAGGSSPGADGDASAAGAAGGKAGTSTAGAGGAGASCTTGTGPAGAGGAAGRTGRGGDGGAAGGAVTPGPATPRNGGGGGGGGYVGGGAGGGGAACVTSTGGTPTATAQPAGGGGGGASYVAPGATGATTTVDTDGRTDARAGLVRATFAAPAGQARLEADVDAVDFGPNAPGVTSDPKVITVTNRGDITTRIGGIELTASGGLGFADDAGTCVGASLPGGGSCTLRLAYTPSVPPYATGVLRIPSDAPGSPLEVPVSGEALTVTRFDFLGAVQPFTVPAGVRHVTFGLDGAGGGNASGNSARDSHGSRVTATLGTVPGDVYDLRSGGRGGTSSSPYLAAGGYNGGGSGGTSGGGGASDVRPAGGDLASRLLVAGGAGGAGDLGAGAGDADAPDRIAKAGTATSGGQGAPSRSCSAFYNGTFHSYTSEGGSDGTVGSGGAAAQTGKAGGGGGGRYGGGGGGVGCDLGFGSVPSSAGAGGSSYATPAATDVTIAGGGGPTGNGAITLRYLGAADPGAGAGTGIAGSGVPAAGGGGGGGAAATVGVLVADATTLSFPATAAGQSSPAQAATLVNRGGTAIDLRSVAIDGPDADDFRPGATSRAARGACAAGTRLEVGDACTVSARFAPKTMGDKRATLKVVAADGASVDVALAGTAVGASSSGTAASPTAGASSATAGSGGVNAGAAPTAGPATGGSPTGVARPDARLACTDGVVITGVTPTRSGARVNLAALPRLAGQTVLLYAAGRRVAVGKLPATGATTLVTPRLRGTLVAVIAGHRSHAVSAARPTTIDALRRVGGRLTVSGVAPAGSVVELTARPTGCDAGTRVMGQARADAQRRYRLTVPASAVGTVYAVRTRTPAGRVTTSSFSRVS